MIALGPFEAPWGNSRLLRGSLGAFGEAFEGPLSALTRPWELLKASRGLRAIKGSYKPVKAPTGSWFSWPQGPEGPLGPLAVPEGLGKATS